MRKLVTLAVMLTFGAVLSAQVTFTATGGDQDKESEGYAKALDHDLETKWYLGGNDKCLLFEASETVQLTGYTFVTGNDNSSYGRCPKEWEIFGSNDAEAATDKTHASWESISYVRGDVVIQNENYTAYYFAQNTAKAYKYYKLKVVYGNAFNGTNASQIAEFIPSYVPEFVPNYIAVDGVGGTGAEGYPRICDGNGSTKICTTERYETPDYTPIHHYFIFRRSEAVAVSKYAFVTGNDSDNRDPKSWELYGMNTSETPSRTDAAWELIDKKSDQTLTTDRDALQEFTVGTPTENTYNTFLLRIKNVSDGGNMMQFDEFRLNEDESGYTALDGVGGTGKEGYDKGFDGDTSTKVCTNERVSDGSFAYWFIIKTGTDLAVNGYSFVTGNDNDGRDPQSWSLYGMKADSQPARDDAGWTLIDSKSDVSDFPKQRLQTIHYDVDDPTENEYNYFKLEVTKLRSGNTVQFGEFNLDGLEVNYDKKLVAYRSMGTWGDGASANLFDGSSTTKWGGSFSAADAATDNKTAGRVTFGPASMEAVSITGYSMQVAGEAGYYDRRPKSWTLYGGNSTTAPERDSDWEEIHTVTNDTELAADARACAYYHLDAPTKPYKYFRLKVTETQGANALQLGELTLFYNNGTMPWLELREETKPVFNGVATVKNAKIKRNITADKWIGLCLPFDYDIPSGWDVRELDHVDGSGETANMKFTAASSIEAGKPYIVNTTSDVTEIAATDKTIGTPATSVEDGGVTMIGNIGQTTIPTGSFYISNEGTLKKLTAATATLKGFRAYFTVDSGSNVKALSFDFDDDETGISLTPSAVSGGSIYNIAGQRLSKMQKGINIVNGKKVLF